MSVHTDQCHARLIRSAVLEQDPERRQMAEERGIPCRCSGCGGRIVERTVCSVLGRPRHSACLRCVTCRCPLLDRCLTRDGESLYCRPDFYRYTARTYIFYRATRMDTADYAVARYLSVCLSVRHVCPSHAGIVCKRLYKVFHRRIATPNAMTIFRREPPNGGVKCNGEYEKSRFSANIGLYLGTEAR